MKLPEPRITAGEWFLSESAAPMGDQDHAFVVCFDPRINGLVGEGSSDSDWVICDVTAFIGEEAEIDKATQLANARAIAKLPNLLTACKAAAQAETPAEIDKARWDCLAAYREAVEG